MSAYPAGRIDQSSVQGKALQHVIQNKLKEFLGSEYADDVLPLYIVVMLAHGNQADLVVDNLEAFLGKSHAQQFTEWLFAHLSEAGEAYVTSNDQLANRSAESSVDASSASEAGLDDGEAMDMDEGQPSPVEEPEASTSGQLTTDVNPHEAVRHGSTQVQSFQAAEGSNANRRRSPKQHTLSHHRHIDSDRSRPEARQQDPAHSRSRPHMSNRSPARDQRDSYRDSRASNGYTRHNRQASYVYGDRDSRQPTRGDTSRRDHRDDQDWHATSREPKRRRSGEYGHRFHRESEADDRGHRYGGNVYGDRRTDRATDRQRGIDALRQGGSRMRSDAIVAQEAARRSAAATSPAEPDAFAQQQPSVRSVVQRVSSGEPDKEGTERPRARAKERPARLFEAAMQKVAAANEGNKPSVFDRLTSQAAQGNTAAAATASTVVRRLQRSAAAAQKQGTSSNNTAALQQKLKQMEEEIIKLRTQQLHLAKRAVETNTATLRTTPVSNPDARSVLVQNVHFTATPQIVAAHFSGAGVVERVTLLKDAITHHPTGKAFIQFQAVAQAAAAISLTGSTLLQRVVTVTPKPVTTPQAASNVRGQMPQHSFAPPLQSFSPRFGSENSWQSQGSRSQSYSRGRGVRGPPALLKSKSNVYVRPGLAK